MEYLIKTNNNTQYVMEYLIKTNNNTQYIMEYNCKFNITLTHFNQTQPSSWPTNIVTVN